MKDLYADKDRETVRDRLETGKTPVELRRVGCGSR